MKEWPGVDVKARLKLISLRRWSMSAVKDPQARVHVPASSNQALSFVAHAGAGLAHLQLLRQSLGVSRVCL